MLGTTDDTRSLSAFDQVSVGHTTSPTRVLVRSAPRLRGTLTGGPLLRPTWFQVTRDAQVRGRMSGTRDSATYDDRVLRSSTLRLERLKGTGLGRPRPAIFSCPICSRGSSTTLAKVVVHRLLSSVAGSCGRGLGRVSQSPSGDQSCLVCMRYARSV